MNIKQLAAFREVMQAGSVSAAARNLHRTQPAISALISGLEEEIGLKLFVRRRGRLHPVPEAHYLLERCSDILGRISATERVLGEIRALDRGVVRVVSMPGPSVFLLPALICRFAHGKEHVRVSVITRSSQAAQDLVSAQQYDVGLADVGYHSSVGSDLVDHDIMRFECLCGIHRDDPLAALDIVTANDLDRAPVAALAEDHPTTALLKGAFADSGAELQIRFEAQYFIPLLTFVEQRLAYAVVDPLSAESYRLYRGDSGVLVFRPFRPAIHLVVSIMTPTRRPPSILASAFVSLMKAELRGIRAGS